MSSQTTAAALVAANPGPAAHIALLGIVVAAALAILGIVRRRNKREAAQAEMHSSPTDHGRSEPRWEPSHSEEAARGAPMTYALLVYISPESWEELSAEDKRSLHGGGQALASVSASVIAHYRLRPPRTATTIRLAGGQIVKTEGPSPGTSEGLRAFYLLETNEPDAVLDFASQHPAVRVGGTAEVWPLTKPGRDA
jgi:hypothetical protein